MPVKVSDYLALIRFDKPIGTLLVLWPTLWGLWLASDGQPSFLYFLISIPFDACIFPLSSTMIHSIPFN